MSGSDRLADEVNQSPVDEETGYIEHDAARDFLAYRLQNIDLPLEYTVYVEKPINNAQADVVFEVNTLPQISKPGQGLEVPGWLRETRSGQYAFEDRQSNFEHWSQTNAAKFAFEVKTVWDKNEDHATKQISEYKEGGYQPVWVLDDLKWDRSYYKFYRDFGIPILLAKDSCFKWKTYNRPEVFPRRI